MNARIALLAVAATMSLAACAPDTHGDLRDFVVIHPPGTAAGRLTFAGIGVGSASEEASAKFENEQGFPRHFVADFGTRLDVLSSGISGGPTRSLGLIYTGNPIAVGRLLDRWKEVFVRAGAACDDEGCLWDDGTPIAFVRVNRRILPSEVVVSVDR